MIFLLDTNILILYLRDKELSKRIDEKYDPLAIRNRPTISVVTLGEIKSLGIQNRWGLPRLKRLELLLSQTIIADINSDRVVETYAEIDAFSQGRLNSRLLNMSARNMGKNDLWIAATASVLDATLLTTDNDFDHLNEEFFKVEKVSINI